MAWRGCKFCTHVYYLILDVTRAIYVFTYPLIFAAYDNNIESDVSGVVSFPLLQSLARHNNSVLSKIEQKEWSILSSIGAVARCAKGEYVLRAGETPSFVGILLQGVLCEQRGDNDEGAVHSKKEFTAAERRLGKGSMLDPNSFFSHQQSAATAKRTFSLVAEQAVMVFVLPYTALQALYT
jgi:CRP-like cAMP-binding protein